MTQLFLNNGIDTIEDEKHKQLLEDINELNQIQQNLLNCVNEQSEQINTIEDNLTLTDLKIEKGTEDLKTAEKYFFNYTPIIFGTAIGALIGGPLGAAVHLKMGSLLSIGGGVIGGMCGYKIQKI